MARGRGNVQVAIRSSFDDKGTKQAESSMARLNGASKKHFGEATKHALGYGAALIGGAGIVGGLEAVVHASIDAEKQQAKLQAQLKASGISWKDHSKNIEDFLAKTSQATGFMDKDLEGALANLVRSTGNLGQSYKLLGLAADVARTKNIDVASAGQLVGRIYAGNTRVLKSLGLSLDPVTKAQDALKASTAKATDEQKRAAKEEDKRATSQKAIALLQQKLGGQAAAYGNTTAGSLDKMKAAVDRLEIKLGNALAPTVQKVADAVSKFVTQIQTGEGAGGRFAKTMGDVWQKLKDVLGVGLKIAGWLKDHPALVKIAIGAWVAYKVAALSSVAASKLALLGLFGPATRTRLATDAGKAGTLTGRTFAGRAGAVAAAAIGGWEIGTWLRKNVGPVRAAGDWLGTQLGKAIFGSAQEHLRITSGQLVNTVRSATGDALNALATPKQRASQRNHHDARPRAHKGSVTAGIASVGNQGVAGARTAMASRIPGVQQGISDVAEAVQRHSGLTVTSTTGGTHAPGSYHYKGEAVDLSGSSAQMAEAVNYIMSSGLYRELAEGIHNPGLSVKNGQVVPPSFWGATTWAGHANHVHLAFIGSGASIPSGGTTPLDALTPRSAPKVVEKIPVVRIPPHSKAFLERGSKILAAKQKVADVAASKRAAFSDRTLNNPWIQAALDHYDYLVATGQMSQADANYQKAKILYNALPKLPEKEQTQAIGMMGDFGFSAGLVANPAATGGGSGEDPNQPLIDAQNAAAEAARQQTDALNALRDELKQSNENVAQIKGVSIGALWGVVADMVNGQIGGYGGAGGRALTAGAGSVARY